MNAVTDADGAALGAKTQTTILKSSELRGEGKQ